jgi:hypothetical protein
MSFALEFGRIITPRCLPTPTMDSLTALERIMALTVGFFPILDLFVGFPFGDLVLPLGLLEKDVLSTGKLPSLLIGKPAPFVFWLAFELALVIVCLVVSHTIFLLGLNPIIN